MENDESIAHALQDEEHFGARQEHFQTSNILAHSCVGAPRRYPSLCTCHFNGLKTSYDPRRQVTEIEIPCLCSTPLEQLLSGAEELLRSFEIRDIFATDDYLNRRMNKQINTGGPHSLFIFWQFVPKTNAKVPSANDAKSDHQRLQERLKLYNLVENEVKGDGNCQFRALADQLYGDPDLHAFVREQLKSQLELYQNYVPMSYSDYLEKMSKEGEWGDHVTLQAAADQFGVKIFLITSFKDTCYIEILPHVQKSKRVLMLSFWAETHYNSINPEADALSHLDVPISQEEKGKKWWKF
ncbi:hypothetical protein ACB092_05G058300 [Castanea dentata]